MIAKKVMPVLFLFLVLFVSDCCVDVDMTNWMNEAEITGYDYRECACCGGYFIDIDGEIYRFYEIPSGSDVEITAESDFPIPVNINWHQFPDGCMGDEIGIDEMERR